MEISILFVHLPANENDICPRIEKPAEYQGFERYLTGKQHECTGERLALLTCDLYRYNLLGSRRRGALSAAGEACGHRLGRDGETGRMIALPALFLVRAQ